MDVIIVRPKRNMTYSVATFDGQAEIRIDLSPFQRWKCSVHNRYARLERKGITLTISREKFDEDWEVA